MNHKHRNSANTSFSLSDFKLTNLTARRVCEYQGGAFVSPLLLAVRGGHRGVCQVLMMGIVLFVGGGWLESWIDIWIYELINYYG